MQQAKTMMMEGKIWSKMILVCGCDFLACNARICLKRGVTPSLIGIDEDSWADQTFLQVAALLDGQVRILLYTGHRLLLLMHVFDSAF